MSEFSPKSAFYFTTLLEQKKVRYQVKKWIKGHSAMCNKTCWRCHFESQLSDGSLNIFEALYVMNQELAHEDHNGTCPAMRDQMQNVPYQKFPPARCIKRKNGTCRCSM